jgi:hypothetical protein
VLFSGMFGSGVYGAVRAVTDLQLRDRNELFLGQAFEGREAYGLLFRVPVLRPGAVVTPDWHRPGVVLHLWSEVT